MKLFGRKSASSLEKSNSLKNRSNKPLKKLSTSFHNVYISASSSSESQNHQEELSKVKRNVFSKFNPFTKHKKNISHSAPSLNLKNQSILKKKAKLERRSPSRVTTSCDLESYNQESPQCNQNKHITLKTLWRAEQETYEGISSADEGNKFEDDCKSYESETKEMRPQDCYVPNPSEKIRKHSKKRVKLPNTPAKKIRVSYDDGFIYSSRSTSSQESRASSASSPRKDTCYSLNASDDLMSENEAKIQFDDLTKESCYSPSQASDEDDNTKWKKFCAMYTSAKCSNGCKRIGETRASDTVIAAQRRQEKQDKTKRILSPLLKHKRRSFHGGLNLEDSYAGDEDFTYFSNKREDEMASQKFKIGNTPALLIQNPSDGGNTVLQNVAMEIKSSGELSGRQVLKPRRGFSRNDPINKEECRSQVRFHSNCERKGGSDSEKPYVGKKKYMSTVKEPIDTGNPVVLVGYIKDKDECSKKVVILASLRQKMAPKTNPVCGSGDSVATLPKSQIPKRVDLYPGKLVAPLRRMFNRESTNRDTNKRFRKLKKQAYYALSKFSKNGKSTSKSTITNDTSGKPERVYSVGSNTLEACQLPQDQEEVDTTASESRLSFISEYDTTKPLTIGRNRPMSVSMRSDIQSVPTISSVQDLSSISDSCSSGYSDYNAVKLSWKMRNIRNDIQDVTSHHVNSLKTCPDSQSLYNNSSVDENMPEEFFVKQHLHTNQTTRTKYNVAAENKAYNIYNVTPEPFDSENECSSSSNSVFYQKLSTIVQDWAGRGLAYLIDPHVLKGLQDAKHVYEEVGSECGYDRPVAQTNHKNHSYDSVKETEDLLNDKESAVFTEDPSESDGGDWYEDYTNNHTHASCYTDPSTPLNRAGVKKNVAPLPRTGVPTHSEYGRKRLALVRIGTRHYCGSNRSNYKSNANVLIPSVSARIKSSQEAYESGDKVRKIDSVMNQITESMFHILSFKPSEYSSMSCDEVCSNHESVVQSFSEYNLLYSVGKFGPKHISSALRTYSKPADLFYRNNSSKKEMYQMYKTLSRIAKQARSEINSTLAVGNYYSRSLPIPDDLNLFLNQRKMLTHNPASLNSQERSKLVIGRERSCVPNAQNIGKSEKNANLEVLKLKSDLTYSNLERVYQPGNITPQTVQLDDKHSDKTEPYLKENTKFDCPQIRTGPTNYSYDYNIYDNVNEDSYDDATISLYSSNSVTHDYDNVFSNSECHSNVELNSIHSSYDHPELSSTENSNENHQSQDMLFQDRENELPGFPGSLKDLSAYSGGKDHTSDNSLEGDTKSKQLQTKPETIETPQALRVSIGHRNEKKTQNSIQNEKDESIHTKSSNITAKRRSSEYTSEVKHEKQERDNYDTVHDIQSTCSKVSYEPKSENMIDVKKSKTNSPSNMDEVFFPIWRGGKWRKAKMPSSAMNGSQFLSYEEKTDNANYSNISSMSLQQSSGKTEHYHSGKSSRLFHIPGSKQNVDDPKQVENKTCNSRSRSKENLRQNESLPQIESNSFTNENKAFAREDKQSLDVNRSACTSVITQNTSLIPEKKVSTCKSRASVDTLTNIPLGQKSLRGQCCLPSEPKQSLCSSRSMPSTSESFSNNDCGHTVSKDLLKLCPMDYSSTNISVVTSWWEDSSQGNKQRIDSSDESMPPRLDSDEDEIRGRFDLTRQVPKSGVSTETTSHAKAALLYLRGDGLLMSQYQPKSTPKKTRSLRKYGMNYPSLEDIHCLQTIGRLQSSSATTTLRSRNLRLTCNDPLCIYVRSVTSNIDLKKHLPVGSWPCRNENCEVTVSLNETKELMERASKTMYLRSSIEDVAQMNNSAVINIPKPSGQQFQPFFPQLYRKHGLIPLANKIINSVVVGAKQIYRHNFAAQYQKSAEKLGENLAKRSFEVGLANYLVDAATKSSKIDLQAEHEFDAVLEDPIRDAIDEAVADEHACKAISAAKRLVIIDNYVKENSPPGTTSSLTHVTDINFSYRAKSLSPANYVKQLKDDKFWKTYKNENIKQISLPNPPSIYAHTKLPTASLGCINTSSRENAKYLLVRHEVKSLLDDVLGAVVVSEELNLNAFKSKPGAHLAYNLSQAMSQERLVKESDAELERLSKHGNIVTSEIEEWESSETESSSYDYEESEINSCKICANSNHQRRSYCQHVLKVPQPQRCVDVSRESNSFATSSDIATSATSISILPIKESRLLCPAKKFIGPVCGNSLHKKFNPRQTVTFNESHLVRWKQITSCSSSSTFPYFPSSDWSVEDDRYLKYRHGKQQSKILHKKRYSSSSSSSDRNSGLNTRVLQKRRYSPRPSARFFTNAQLFSNGQENTVKRNPRVFGNAPTTLLQKFGNFAKRFTDNNKTSSKDSSEESCYDNNGRSPETRKTPFPSANGPENDRVDNQVEVIVGAENSHDCNSVMNDLTINRFLLACDTFDETKECEQGGDIFQLRKFNDEEKDKQWEKAPGHDVPLHGRAYDVLKPSGMPHSSDSSNSYGNSSSYSSYNPYDSLNKFLKDETEATYTYSEETSTDYEYIEGINSIRKTKAKSENSKSGMSSLYKRIDSIKLQQPGKLCRKAYSCRNVMIGNPSNGKSITKCDSLQSFSSATSSFLDRKYKSLTSHSHTVTNPSTIESVYACTQTDKKPLTNLEKRKSQSLLTELKPIEDTATVLQQQTILPSSSQDSIFSGADNLQKVSDKSLNQCRLEALGRKYLRSSALTTSLVIEKNTRKLAPRTRSSSHKVVSVLREPEDRSRSNVISEKSPINDQNYSGSVDLTTTMTNSINDTSNSKNSVNDKHPAIYKNPANDENLQTINSKDGPDYEAEPISLPREDIKRLLNELSEEMNGVREVVNCSKSDEGNVKSEVKEDSQVPQISKGCDSSSSTDQLTLMLNELQSTLIALASEIIVRKPLECQNDFPQTSKNICSSVDISTHTDDNEPSKQESNKLNCNHEDVKLSDKTNLENLLVDSKKPKLVTNSSGASNYKSIDINSKQKVHKANKNDCSENLSFDSEKSKIIQNSFDVEKRSQRCNATRSKSFKRTSKQSSTFRTRSDLSRRRLFRKKDYFIEGSKVTGDIKLHNYKEETASSTSCFYDSDDRSFSPSCEHKSNYTGINKTEAVETNNSILNVKAENKLAIFPHPSCHPKRQNRLPTTSLELGDNTKTQIGVSRVYKRSSSLSSKRRKNPEFISHRNQDCLSNFSKDDMQCKTRSFVESKQIRTQRNREKDNNQLVPPINFNQHRYLITKSNYHGEHPDLFDEEVHKPKDATNTSRENSPKTKSVKFADEFDSANDFSSDGVNFHSSKIEMSIEPPQKGCCNLRHVDQPSLSRTRENRHRYSHGSAHLRANEPNDSVQLPVPELKEYFEDISQCETERRSSESLSEVDGREKNTEKAFPIDCHLSTSSVVNSNPFNERTVSQHEQESAIEQPKEHKKSIDLSTLSTKDEATQDKIKRDANLSFECMTPNRSSKMKEFSNKSQCSSQKLIHIGKDPFLNELETHLEQKFCTKNNIEVGSSENVSKRQSELPNGDSEADLPDKSHLFSEFRNQPNKLEKYKMPSEHELQVARSQEIGLSARGSQQFLQNMKKHANLKGNPRNAVRPSAGEKRTAFFDRGSSPFPVTSQSSSCSDDLEQEECLLPRIGYSSFRDSFIAPYGRRCINACKGWEVNVKDQQLPKGSLKKAEICSSCNKKLPSSYFSQRERFREMSCRQRPIDIDDTEEIREEKSSPELAAFHKYKNLGEETCDADAIRNVSRFSNEKHDLTPFKNTSSDSAERLTSKLKPHRSRRCSRPRRHSNLYKSSSTLSLNGKDLNSKSEVLSGKRRKKLKRRMKNYFRKFMLREPNARQVIPFPTCNDNFSQNQRLPKQYSCTKFYRTSPACPRTHHKTRKHCIANKPCCYHQEAKVHHNGDSLLCHKLPNEQYCDKKRRQIIADINFLRGLDSYKVLNCRKANENRACSHGPNVSSCRAVKDIPFHSQGNLNNENLPHSSNKPPPCLRHSTENADRLQAGKVFNDSLNEKYDPNLTRLEDYKNFTANSSFSNQIEAEEILECGSTPTAHCLPVSKTKCALSAVQTVFDTLCRAIAICAILYFLLHVDSSQYGEHVPI